MKNLILFFQKKESMQKDALETSILAIAGRGLGFFIPILIAAWFGTNRETDAFFFAYAIWLFVTLAFGNVFETVVVPFAAEHHSQNKEVSRFIGTILGKSAVILAVIALAILLGIKPVLRMVTRFSPETIDLVWVLMLEMCPMIFLSLATDTVNGVFNAYKIFHVSALSPAFRSLVVILTIFLFKNGAGVHAMAWAYVVGEGVRFLISGLTFLQKVGKMEKAKEETPETVSFFKCVMPQLLGLTFINLIFLVDQSMASWFGPGALTVYAYAERIRNVLFLFFSAGAGSVVLSHWANQFSASSEPVVWQKISRVIWVLFWVSAFFSVGMALFRLPLSTLLFKRGQFPEGSLAQVSSLFGILVMGVPFQVISLLGVRFLIVLKRNTFYMLLGLTRLVLDVPFNFLFMRFAGINGIALSTTFLDILFAFLIYQRMKLFVTHPELK